MHEYKGGANGGTDGNSCLPAGREDKKNGGLPEANPPLIQNLS